MKPNFRRVHYYNYILQTNNSKKINNSTHVGRMLEQVICLNYSLAIQAWDTSMQLVLKYIPEGGKKNIFSVSTYFLFEIYIILTIEFLSLFFTPK